MSVSGAALPAANEYLWFIERETASPIRVFRLYRNRL
jgi:hypothetical protein